MFGRLADELEGPGTVVLHSLAAQRALAVWDEAKKRLRTPRALLVLVIR